MKWFLFIGVLMLIFNASASDAAITFESIEQVIEVYNASVENAPQVVKTLLGNEIVKVEITQDNGTALVLGLVAVNAEVVEIIEGEPEDPTIVAKAEQDALTRILESEDPVTVFQKARDDGEISIEGTDFWTNMKVSAVLSSTSALKFFADMTKA